MCMHSKVFLEVGYMNLAFDGFDQHVVQISLHVLPQHVLEALVDHSLIGCPRLN